MWGHSSHAERLFSLQRRALRVLTGLGYRDDVRDMFKSKKIMTLPSRYIFECVLYARANLPEYVSVSSIHSYDTRNNSDLRLEFFRLKKSWYSKSHFAPTFYNKLPSQIKNLSDTMFKAAIKKCLIEKAFYTFDEFMNSVIV